MADTAITSAQSKDFDIPQCLVVSNDQNTKVDISTLITDLYYYESVLSPTVKVDLIYAETGKSVEKDGSFKTVIEGLPLVGTEKVGLTLVDPKNVELKLSLYVDNVKPIYNDVVKSVASLNLVSKEAIFNYKSVVNTRFDGKISDHIGKILKDVLKVDEGTKKLDIEETANNYNFIGNNKRPFYVLLWLAKKAVPKASSLGNSAGYFLFETSDGYKFKSVEGLLSDTDLNGSKKKYKSLVYNDTPDGRGANVPPEYSGKILEYNIDTAAGNVESKLEVGTYSTRTVLFNPFNCYYEIVYPNTKTGDKANEKNLKKAGNELPKYNKEFDGTGNGKDYSRTQYVLVDCGSMPSGSTDQQIQKSQEENFDPRNILNQSVMRYNQFFSSQVTITITGDFSFHAGDYIYIDTPQLSDKKTQTMDEQFGGFYVIAELCHYINLTTGGYTKLTLVRDSVGRKGSPIPL